MDKLSRAERSANMSRIRASNTAPELAVRRHLFHAGLRYRLYRRDLPGKPDLVFPRYRICLFVHGCFWHGCPNCIDGTRRVKSNEGYWSEKVKSNRQRDILNAAKLEAEGWRVLTIWECEVRDISRLENLEALIRRGRSGYDSDQTS
ncbi:very short patch repair endonuclease [Mesorhizobium sp. 113-1-2]|uniref:very short patch repair endonuclease n=1 Tax=Mesorhizobium sp. 113-1-2 TaxID=2744515 RepID=UPI001926D815|nr:very short patch repair endonuclease [Mesorhizobium sp. 113-1-2]